jgi:hypothetical protein
MVELKEATGLANLTTTTSGVILYFSSGKKNQNLAGILSRDDLYTKPNIGNHN